MWVRSLGWKDPLEEYTADYTPVLLPGESHGCLDLPSWKEFLGFDREGQNGWFDIDLDEETGEAVFRKAEDSPFGFRNDLDRLQMILDPAAVKKVAADTDLPWEQEETVLPGPYEQFIIHNSQL